jgi:hypothetical protein
MPFLRADANDCSILEQSAAQLALRPVERQPHDAFGFHPLRFAVAMGWFMLVVATGAVVDNHGAVPGGERHDRDDVGLTRPHAANTDRIAVLEFRFNRGRQVGRHAHEQRCRTRSSQQQAVDFAVSVHDEAFDNTSCLGQTIWIDPMHDDHLRS